MSDAPQTTGGAAVAEERFITVQEYAQKLGVSLC